LIFQSIENLSDKQERALKLSTRIAHSWQNAEKNRYRNVSAYDCSRVVLKKTSDDQSDYINASPLSIPLAKRNYILTQGPLPSTCADFWQMVWEQECTLVVMLNKVVEKNCVKCHEYFASTQRPVRVFGTFEVHLRSEEQCEHYVMRTLELVTTDGSLVSDSSQSASRSVLHFQFVSWPDFGVPHCSRVFLDFLDRVRATGRLQQLAPVVVHCSAGIGRSGTFVVVDSVLSMIDEKVESIDMEELVVKMRRHRMGLIQTPQQLQFCWKTIAEALKMQRDSERSSKANEPSKAIDPRPTCIIANTGRGDGPPHLERSAANQMTSGQHAKSLTDISGTIRKRSSGEQCESEEDAKYARRFVCFVSFLLSYTSPTDRMHKPSKYGILFSTVGSWSGVCRRGFDIFLFFPHNVSRRKG
uniref:protein-tyrosine-phosphatase n=1 Tax=Ascaris lumbricoides TaxID=6252 RepID=A0A0M3IKQ7_ASCLU